MTPRYIDIGLNLASAKFSDDWRDVIKRGQDAGVDRFILTGTSVETARRCQELVEKFPAGVAYFTAGVHPHYASSLGKAGIAYLRDLLRDTRAVAVGETGLDFDRDLSPRGVQRDSFRRHIELACEMGKPMFLHERSAHEDFLRILDEAGASLPSCVVHCFTGGPDLVKEYVSRGFYIGITGWAGQARRNKALLQALPLIPADRLLLETDAPYLAPDGYRTHRPGRNEPDAMPEVARAVAARRVDPGDLAEQAYANTLRFFGIQREHATGSTANATNRQMPG